MKIAKKKKTWRILLGLLLLGGIIIVTFMGLNLYIYFTTPKEYMIQTENHFDFQPGYECSGYSSAYVLRSLGIKADGMQLYEQIPNKNPDGTVPVKKLAAFLKEQNYNAKVYNGTIWQLQNAISKGVPVIAFVKISPDAQYYHYLPIVGYDKDYFYAAESLSDLKNAEEKQYNRKISIADFENMWSTEVERKNTYITIKLK